MICNLIKTLHSFSPDVMFAHLKANFLSLDIFLIPLLHAVNFLVNGYVFEFTYPLLAFSITMLLKL